MLNNKGFTLIEVLASIVIISLLTFVILHFSGSTFSVSKNEAYEIMKDNIYKVSLNFLKECDEEILKCNLNWNENKVEFYAKSLYENGYFKNLNSPIDGKNIGNCLLIKATKDNGVIDIKLIDNCY